MKSLLQIYAVLLRLYPARYREELADEMRATFTDILNEASELGSWSLLSSFLRELRDHPGAVVREYWRLHQQRKGERIMPKTPIDNSLSGSVKPTLNSPDQPASWKEAILAGLPHLLVSALLLVITLTSGETARSSSPRVVGILEIATTVFAWSLLGVLVVALWVAWRRGWPRWSASYYFYAFLMVSAPILWLLQNLDLPWAYMGMDILMSPVYIVLLVAWCVTVAQRDVVKGLLMIAPVAVFSWWLNLEFIPNEIKNPLQLGMLLLITLAAVVIARFGSWRSGIWTILASSMLVGVPISYFRTYHHNIPPGHYSPASLAMLTGRYAEATFWSAILVIGPLLVWVFWELGNRFTWSGQPAYRLVFSGLLLNLTSNLVAKRGYGMDFTLRDPLWELLLSFLIILSFLIYVTGIIQLFRSVREEGIVKDNKIIALLFIAALGLPLMFMFPMFEMRRYAPSNMPFGLFYENNVPDLLVYGLSTVWLFAGAWLVTRLSVPKRITPDPLEAP